MHFVSSDTTFAQFALDPEPLNLKLVLNPKEKRIDPFVFTYFPQIDVWGGHIAYWGNEDMRKSVTPFVYHLNSVGSGDKQNLFNEFGLWMLDDKMECKKKPGLFSALTGFL